MLKNLPWFPALAVLPALAVACCQTALHAQTTAPSINKIVVFGDSLSDTGNVADTVQDSDFSGGARFPGPDGETFGSQYDYTDGRFTDGTDTDPAAVNYTGVWHEQLAKLFLNLPAASASLDNGQDFAFGDATTEDGQTTISEAGGLVSIKVDNMGKQVDNYLAGGPADGNALIIVWGGANDVLNGDDAPTAADRETALVRRLAEAGGKTFLVPNLPPIDRTPKHSGDATLMQASIDFNTRLKADLEQTLEPLLASEGLTVTIYELDVYGLYQRLLTNQFAYGFTNITDAAQGQSDPDHYLSWDGLHPTTAGHFQVAAEAYTVLTGIPVVEVYPSENNDGFYLTRTGPDVSAKIKAHYVARGGAVAGQDYEPVLSGVRKMPPGAHFVTVNVTPTAAGAGKSVKLKLKPGASYVRPVVKTAAIHLQQAQ